MALIKVGIHENLVFTDKTMINDKGSLEIGIAVDTGGDILDAFRANTTYEEMESVFRIYPPSPTDYTKRTKSGHDIAKDLLAIREQLMTFALLYGSEDEVVNAMGGTLMLEGNGIEDLSKAVETLVQEDYRMKVYTKLVNLWLDFLASKKAIENPVKFRMKFPRQSDDKNFSTLPKGDRHGPWIEPMTIPKDASKICWSQWEIENNRNSNAPVASTPAKSIEVDEATTEALFGKSADPGQPAL